MEDSGGSSADGRAWERRGVAIPLALVAVTVVCGTVGTYRYLTTTYRAVPAGKLLFDSLLTSFGFLVLNSGPYPVGGGGTPPLVYLGRATGVLFFSYAALVGFGALFAEQLKPVRVRAWHLRDRLGGEGFVVVCGLGRKGYQLASRLLADGRDVVVVDAGAEASRADDVSDRGAVVFRADATRRRTLGRRAKAHLAAEVFVNCGSDRTNAEVVRTLSNWLDDRPTPHEYVECHAHLAARRQRHFVHDQLGDRADLRVRTYDTATVTARELLRRRPPGRFGTNPDAERVHVVLFGWGRLCEALVFELCERMHYLSDHERAITVVCRDPAAARAELYDDYPALDPNRWDDPDVAAFVESLFPDLSFVRLPANEDVLLSDRFGLYDRLRPRDVLTVVVADEDGFRSGAAVSTMLPRLESVERELGVDTTVHYFAETADDDARRRDELGVRIESPVVDTEPFGPFVERCTPTTVRGERRDWTAKRMALFFHLRYAYGPAVDDPTETDRALAERVSTPPPDGRGYPYDVVSDLWERASATQVAELAEVVWRGLSGTDREANRHAADHAPIKRRLAASLDDADEETVVRRLSATEHRRWCAEKFLDGWEPLPEAEAAKWNRDAEAQARFREQKYHLDLRPEADLRRLTDGEAEKDDSLVRFVLDHADTAARPGRE